MLACVPPLAYLAVTAFVAIRRKHDSRPNALDLGITYAPDLFWLLPLLWLIPLALHAGSKAALVLDAAGAIAVLWGLAGLTPKPARPRAGGGPALRVATFNLYGGSLDIHGCVAFLVSAEPDLVFLQEAWWTFKHRRTDDRTLPAIIAAFEGWHVFRSDEPHEMMIVSRHPLRDPRTVRLGNRVCLVATIETPAGETRVINVHLDPPATGRRLRESGKPLLRFMLETETDRRRQGEALAALVAESDTPTVVAGDFNAPPQAPARRCVRPLLADAFATAGRGFGYTFPRTLPLWRIDYVLTTRHWTIERCFVAPADGSDHLPLVADLRLTAPQGANP